MSKGTTTSFKDSKPNSMYFAFNKNSSFHLSTMLLNEEEVKVCTLYRPIFKNIY